MDKYSSQIVHGSIYCVRRRNKNSRRKLASNLVNIVGFRVAGETITIHALNVTNLPKWASGRIKGKRKAKKKDLADAIVTYRAGNEH